MVQLDLTDRMAHEEHVTPLRRTVPVDLTEPMLQAVDLQVVALLAEHRVVLMDPRVQLAHMDLTHQVDRTYGSFCRCVRIDGNARKQKFGKRHLVTSKSG